ncbi:hypothetical protein GUITHDRAFT_149153 [Guillardia theta CCMP2712]|uniref:Uncharacterized protein n=1 Tax=Guillardia theta (strain CCMP2712) TaxID=905079 RepID=L1I600_GUITC|nr:hypothetical protein GUITHDRAFT_149153 [Guillardia theta CCMP2712]EKX31676.1 hypothetical protein GUITHDRAFT_149153 [Guillardia theta CCMP2712]|eukprot:XP_005818656.1 hypothetical protein GUITHDRAFT_149153 [Guillardia theta CCMP2712]
MNERRLKDVVDGALMHTVLSDNGLSLERIRGCDWHGVEEVIEDLRRLGFREPGDFEALFEKKDELLGHMKHFSIENALEVELSDQLENHLRPFMSCACLVAEMQLNVLEKAFANVADEGVAYRLVGFFDDWKECLLECNHTFQEIGLESTYQHGERAMMEDFYQRDLFCFTLMQATQPPRSAVFFVFLTVRPMQDKVYAIVSEALSPFIVSRPLYRGYEEQGYEYTVLMRPPGELPGASAELFGQVYRDAKRRVEEAKESICQRVSMLDHPRDELVTRFECDILFQLDIGLPLPLGHDPGLAVNGLGVETVIDRDEGPASISLGAGLYLTQSFYVPPRYTRYIQPLALAAGGAYKSQPTGDSGQLLMRKGSEKLKEHRELTQRNEALLERHQQLLERNQQPLAENESLKSHQEDYVALQREHETLQERLSSIQSGYDRLILDDDKLKSKDSHIKGENTHLIAKNRSMKEQNRRLRDEIVSCKRLNQTLRKTIATLEEQISELESIQRRRRRTA